MCPRISEKDIPSSAVHKILSTSSSELLILAAFSFTSLPPVYNCKPSTVYNCNSILSRIFFDSPKSASTILGAPSSSSADFPRLPIGPKKRPNIYVKKSAEVTPSALLITKQKGQGLLGPNLVFPHYQHQPA